MSGGSFLEEVRQVNFRRFVQSLEELNAEIGGWGDNALGKSEREVSPLLDVFS